jgi:hypothetical protein
MSMWLHILLAMGLLAPPQGLPGPPAPLTDRQKALEQESLAQLLSVRRVHVDRLTGGETAAQIRDMIISSLQAAKLFVLTENPERADAFLRGSAEDLVFTDTFSSTEGLNVRGNLGTGSSQQRGTTNRRGAYAGVGLGEQESTRIAERKHEASAAVRLVNKDGDVIWSTTQESLGGKFRGASADVADKITRQLISDFERARKPPPK